MPNQAVVSRVVAVGPDASGSGRRGRRSALARCCARRSARRSRSVLALALGSALALSSGSTLAEADGLAGADTVGLGDGVPVMMPPLPKSKPYMRIPTKTATAAMTKIFDHGSLTWTASSDGVGVRDEVVGAPLRRFAALLTAAAATTASAASGPSSSTSSSISASSSRSSPSSSSASASSTSSAGSGSGSDSGSGSGSGSTSGSGSGSGSGSARPRARAQASARARPPARASAPARARASARPPARAQARLGRDLGLGRGLGLGLRLRRRDPVRARARPSTGRSSVRRHSWRAARVGAAGPLRGRQCTQVGRAGTAATARRGWPARRSPRRRRPP